MADNDYLTGIDYPHPFDDHVVSLCESASRYVNILSPRLDPEVFDNEPLAAALRTLVRSSRQTQVRILIRDPRLLVGTAHRLLELSRRTPSTVHLRRLDEHPDWSDETIVIRDRDGVLYKHGDRDTDAFCEPASRAGTSRHLELFDSLWRLSVEDPDLRRLAL